MFSKERRESKKARMGIIALEVKKTYTKCRFGSHWFVCFFCFFVKHREIANYKMTYRSFEMLYIRRHHKLIWGLEASRSLNALLYEGAIDSSSAK
jgi:hypothetical protein